MTSKTLTVRLPVTLYSYVCDMAGEIGMPNSTFIRTCIEKEHDANAMERFRIELIHKFEELRTGIIQSSSSENNSIEILYLLRALVADRNPQLIQNVQARLSQIQPNQKGN